ncbi:MAG: GrpB family protein [Bifidobacteriaceae bacterium]|nr:GrpB family protein [Bifidobacteriaceae bacterium]
MRTHPNEAREYGELKSRLAAQFPEDIEGYCDGKDVFVQKLEREALMEHWRLESAGR